MTQHEPFGAEGEHPVSAKCWGLRNQFVRWWVQGFTPGNPIFVSLFETNVIVPGANRVSAAFQPRFSRVSAAFHPLEIFLCADFFCDPKVSAFLKVKLLVKLLIFVF